ncbi:MAG: hypothetical protein OXM61_03570 [Candidatus Poribacteria bacterium]|nr:hypothetical protein [Candidatus Poribacteria bacterium]
MIKRCFSITIITLTFLSTILFTYLIVDAVAEVERVPTDGSVQKSDAIPVAIPEDSVLNLIPQTSLGLIYCPSLTELNHSINVMASDMLPQLGQAELLAMILANAFGAGFQSFADLEEIGLDLKKDFAVFFTSLKPMHVSAAVHLTDPEAIKQVIEAEGNATMEYKGVTYWSSAEGGSNFAILENTLVYSQQTEVCKNVIDTHNGTMQAITNNPDCDMFLTEILKGTNQLGVFFDVASITTKLDGSLEEELESMTENLEGENDPLSMGTSVLFRRMFGSWTRIIEQLEFGSVFLQLQDMDVQLKPFLKFKSDSKFLNGFKTPSTDLANLDEMPNNYILNCGFQGIPDLLVEISTFWFDILNKETPEEQKHLHPLFQEVKGFYESLADQWSVSVNFENSIVPDYLFVYELKDEQNAKNYMDEVLIKKLHDFKQAQAGEPLMHNGVEIKSYIFPNYEIAGQERLPEASEMIPSEWHWHYAFSDGQLFWTTGTSAESIKMALDRQTGMDGKFSDNPSYQKLVESLGTDNNIFLAVSPIIAVKNFVPLLAKIEPGEAASIQMFSVMFMNLPDNYSFGFSAKAEDNGIDAKIILTLSDFKPLFQMLGMLFGTGQM